MENHSETKRITGLNSDPKIDALDKTFFTNCLEHMKVIVTNMPKAYYFTLIYITLGFHTYNIFCMWMENMYLCKDVDMHVLVNGISCFRRGFNIY